MKKLNIIFEITIRQVRKLSGGATKASEQKEEEEEEDDEEEFSVSFKDVTPKQRPSCSSSSMLKKTRFSDVSNCLFLYFFSKAFENIKNPFIFKRKHC